MLIEGCTISNVKQKHISSNIMKNKENMVSQKENLLATQICEIDYWDLADKESKTAIIKKCSEW